MASEPDPAEFAAFIDRIFRESDVSMLLPLFFGMASAAARSAAPENPDRESSEETGGERRAPTPRERLILVDAVGRRMLVIDGDSGLDSLFQELEGKQGQPPASKASIDAMPTVTIGGGGSSECVICLEEFEVGGEAKEMPCKHRFHGGCIEKWLNRHGSCPVCRYMMPVEEEAAAKKAEDDGGEGRRGDGQIRVSIYVTGSGRTTEGSDQTPAGNDGTESS